MRKPISKLRLWAIMVCVITGLSGLGYILSQQILRQTANDPQIQLAEDAAAALGGGKNPEEVMLADQVNPGNSLAPFEIFYDSNGSATASSISGQVPSLPPGVLQSTKKRGEDRLTWQPSRGLRIAAVVKYYGNGYVLAGRSLREVEHREDWLWRLVGVAWLVIVSIVTALIAR